MYCRKLRYIFFFLGGFYLVFHFGTMLEELNERDDAKLQRLFHPSNGCSGCWEPLFLILNPAGSHTLRLSPPLPVFSFSGGTIFSLTMKKNTLFPANNLITTMSRI